MFVPFHAIAQFMVTIVAAANSPETIPLDLHRCANSKTQKPDLLAILVVVSSVSTQFSWRSKLRQTDFQDARSVQERHFYRPSATPIGSISNSVQKDRRPVCVQPVFVLSPWHELRHWHLLVNQHQWHRISAEQKKHRDILIAPTMIKRGGCFLIASVTVAAFLLFAFCLAASLAFSFAAAILALTAALRSSIVTAGSSTSVKAAFSAAAFSALRDCLTLWPRKEA